MAGVQAVGGRPARCSTAQPSRPKCHPAWPAGLAAGALAPPPAQAPMGAASARRAKGLLAGDAPRMRAPRRPLRPGARRPRPGLHLRAVLLHILLRPLEDFLAGGLGLLAGLRAAWACGLGPGAAAIESASPRRCAARRAGAPELARTSAAAAAFLVAQSSSRFRFFSTDSGTAALGAIVILRGSAHRGRAVRWGGPHGRRQGRPPGPARLLPGAGRRHTASWSCISPPSVAP